MLKKIITYSLELNKYFNLISIRYSKKIMLLLNSVLAFFSGLLCYYSLKFIVENKNKTGAMLFLVSLMLVSFAELININFKNSFNSIYTLNKIDIYPVSKLEHLKNLFFSDFFNFRLIYYIVLFSLILFFSVNFNFLFVLQSVLIFIFTYIIVTAIFTLTDYGYASLIKLYGEKAKYSMLIFFLLLSGSMSLLDKFNINIDDILTKVSNVINFLLNK